MWKHISSHFKVFLIAVACGAVAYGGIHLMILGIEMIRNAL